MTNQQRIEAYQRRRDASLEFGPDLYPRPLAPFTEKHKEIHLQCLATPFQATVENAITRTVLQRMVWRMMSAVITSRR